MHGKCVRLQFLSQNCGQIERTKYYTLNCEKRQSRDCLFSMHKMMYYGDTVQFKVLSDVDRSTVTGLFALPDPSQSKTVEPFETVTK